MIKILVDTGFQRSDLENEAERLIQGMFLRDSGRRVSMKPGAYIQKHGHKFPLKHFKAKHFDHRSAYFDKD